MAGLPRTLPELIKKAIAGALQDVHVALPGCVVRWDATANLADVQVQVQHPVWDDDNGRTYEDLGTLLGVPVMWPRAGGFVLTLPMAAGDYGLLVFCSSPIGEWRSTGQSSQPVDASRLSIGWPVFIPGAFPDSSPYSVSDPHDSVAILGKDGAPQQIRIGASDIKLGATATIPVGLATPTTTAITALQTEVAAIGAYIAALTAAFVANPAVYAPTAVAMVTPGATAATAIGVGAAAVPVQVALIPATIVKAL